MTNVALGIIHAAHVPGREAQLDRLLCTLNDTTRPIIDERIHSVRETPREWARRSWNWALMTGADFSVILNDDVIVAPMFWPALYAMLEVFPRRTVLGLGTVDPAQEEAFKRGERWLNNGHGVVGWAVGMRREEIQLLVDEEARLPADHRSSGHDECRPDCPHWHEDSWTNEVLAKHQIPVWHPIPSIVQHDVSLPSLYGNDHHKTRTAPVTWDRLDMTRADFWRP